MVAYRLVDLVGRASGANILGITVRELDKLVEIFELSEKFKNLRKPGAGLTWARELMGVSKKLLSPVVIKAVVEKVNQKRITNSKDLRKLRMILGDPVARDNFLSAEGDIDSALLRLSSAQRKSRPRVLAELDAAMDAMAHIPWTAMDEMKRDPEALQKIERAEALLKSLRKALVS